MPVPCIRLVCVISGMARGIDSIRAISVRMQTAGLVAK